MVGKAPVFLGGVGRRGVHDAVGVKLLEFFDLLLRHGVVHPDPEPVEIQAVEGRDVRHGEVVADIEVPEIVQVFKGREIVEPCGHGLHILQLRAVRERGEVLHKGHAHDQHLQLRHVAAELHGVQIVVVAEVEVSELRAVHEVFHVVVRKLPALPRHGGKDPLHVRARGVARAEVHAPHDLRVRQAVAQAGHRLVGDAAAVHLKAAQLRHAGGDLGHQRPLILHRDVVEIHELVAEVELPVEHREAVVDHGPGRRLVQEPDTLPAQGRLRLAADVQPLYIAHAPQGRRRVCRVRVPETPQLHRAVGLVVGRAEDRDRLLRRRGGRGCRRRRLHGGRRPLNRRGTPALLRAAGQRQTQQRAGQKHGRAAFLLHHSP